MKYFLILILVFGGITYVNTGFAQCLVNTDWPEAPCMDLVANGRYPQNQVDGWAAYYDYKGPEFMESKKAQLDLAIKEGRLLQWVNESMQNTNVWYYYHFSGLAPSPYPQKIGFDPINRNITTSYHDFRNTPSIMMVYSCDGPGLASKESCEFQNAMVMGIVGLAVAGAISIPMVLFGRKRK